LRKQQSTLAELQTTYHVRRKTYLGGA
jgi:hypothetical protein